MGSNQSEAISNSTTVYSIIMSNCRVLFVLSCYFTLSAVQSWSSSSTRQRQPPHSQQVSPASASADPILTRRQIAGWSAGLLSAALVTTVLNPIKPVQAKEELLTPPTAAEIQQALQTIRDELTSPDGIPYIQKLIETEDYKTLMAFTPQYDLGMRKLKMGKAAKVMGSIYATEAEKEQKKAFATTCTLAKNAVTFDLIGINRATRPGQQDKEKALKYLQELKDDMQKFLDLENTLDLTKLS
jgi:hypothetical protein